MRNFKKALSFDDVLLVPKSSDIKTRKDIDLKSSISDLDFYLPVISSPMDTVTETSMSISMSKAGGFGIIHRYNSISEQSLIVSRVKKVLNPSSGISAAIGVSGDFIERASELHEAGANIICIDVAHGHHLLVKNTIEQLRKRFDNRVYIIAGNVATKSGYEDLSDWGANAVRVGVGGGSICSTRIQTGHGIPTFQSVVDCSDSDRSAAIIADGGIKNSGDAVKALAAGADFVMLGSLLAGTDETPGDIIRPAESKDLLSENRKVYRGMASREAQQSWRNKIGSVEGISTTVLAKGPVLTVLHDLERGIRSGLSYTGAYTLSELRSKSEFIIQTTGGFRESSTHIIS